MGKACLDFLLQAFWKEAIRENLANETGVKTAMKSTPFPTMPSGETALRESGGEQISYLWLFDTLTWGCTWPPARDHHRSQALQVTAFPTCSCLHPATQHSMEPSRHLPWREPSQARRKWQKSMEGQLQAYAHPTAAIFSPLRPSILLSLLSPSPAVRMTLMLL